MTHREPQPLRNLLPQVLRQLSQETGAAKALEPVWFAVAGPLIAKHASPARWEGDTLVLHVAHARWLRELVANEPTLRARLTQALGRRPLARLDFRLA